METMTVIHIYAGIPNFQVIVDLVVRLGKEELPNDLINLNIEAFPTGSPDTTKAAVFEHSPTLGYLAFLSKEADDAEMEVTPLGPDDVEVLPYLDTPVPIKTGEK